MHYGKTDSCIIKILNRDQFRVYGTKSWVEGSKGTEERRNPYFASIFTSDYIGLQTCN
jgi:hypothetical protein